MAGRPILNVEDADDVVLGKRALQKKLDQSTVLSSSSS